jgi:uncharacterized protein YndB with AHSA1/START domain
LRYYSVDRRKERGVAVPDRIRRELTLQAPRDRVWRALTDPAELVRWFPTRSAELDLRPGGALRLSWEHDGDEGFVDEVEPGRRLLFRWRPQGSRRPHTRVTVTLDDAPGGATTLVLVEDGFAALAADVREQTIIGNTQGWSEELEELRALVEAA